MFRSKKGIKAILTFLTVMFVATSNAFAETTVDATALLETGLQSAVNDVMGMVAVILPIALGLFATFWGIRKGMQFFRSTAR